MAGVPVVSTVGRGGGWELVGGSRTDLTGLTDVEARALFAAAGPAVVSTPELRAALRKLVAALPEPFRAAAETASRSVVVDPGDWADGPHDGEGPGPSSGAHLETVQQAVFGRRRLDLVVPGPPGLDLREDGRSLRAGGQGRPLVPGGRDGGRPPDVPTGPGRGRRGAGRAGPGPGRLRPEGRLGRHHHRRRRPSVPGHGRGARRPGGRGGAHVGLPRSVPPSGGPTRRAASGWTCGATASSWWPASWPGSAPPSRWWRPVEARRLLATLGAELVDRYGGR